MRDGAGDGDPDAVAWTFGVRANLDGVAGLFIAARPLSGWRCWLRLLRPDRFRQCGTLQAQATDQKRREEPPHARGPRHPEGRPSSITSERVAECRHTLAARRRGACLRLHVRRGGCLASCQATNAKNLSNARWGAPIFVVKPQPLGRATSRSRRAPSGRTAR